MRLHMKMLIQWFSVLLLLPLTSQDISTQSVPPADTPLSNSLNSDSPTTAPIVIGGTTLSAKDMQLNMLKERAKAVGLPRGMASYTTVPDGTEYKLVITGARSDRIDVVHTNGDHMCEPKCNIAYAGSEKVRVCDCERIRYNPNGTLANNRFPPFPGSYFDRDEPDSGFPTRGVIWTNDNGWKVIEGARIIIAAVCFRIPCCTEVVPRTKLCPFNVSYIPNWELPVLNRTVAPKSGARHSTITKRELLVEFLFAVYWVGNLRWQ